MKRFARFHPSAIVLLSHGDLGSRRSLSVRNRLLRPKRSSMWQPARFELAAIEDLDRRSRRRALRKIAAARRKAFIRLPSGWWVRSDQVRLAMPSVPPREVGLSTKWVDIDLQEQTLVAYEGTRPVYATLVSTGRHHRTPVGLFRVWAKLAKTDMQGTRQTEDDENPELTYSMWDVPWTMYFKAGIALHGTYWHGLFGRVRSHGCVNLSPMDAKWIFDWSDPAMPVGWSAILPGRGDASLMVRIRHGGVTPSLDHRRIRPDPRR